MTMTGCCAEMLHFIVFYFIYFVNLNTRDSLQNPSQMNFTLSTFFLIGLCVIHHSSYLRAIAIETKKLVPVYSYKPENSSLFDQSEFEKSIVTWHNNKNCMTFSLLQLASQQRMSWCQSLNPLDRADGQNCCSKALEHTVNGQKAYKYISLMCFRQTLCFWVYCPVHCGHVL